MNKSQGLLLPLPLLSPSRQKSQAQTKMSPWRTHQSKLLNRCLCNFKKIISWFHRNDMFLFSWRSWIVIYLNFSNPESLSIKLVITNLYCIFRVDYLCVTCFNSIFAIVRLGPARRQLVNLLPIFSPLLLGFCFHYVLQSIHQVCCRYNQLSFWCSTQILLVETFFKSYLFFMKLLLFYFSWLINLFHSYLW